MIQPREANSWFLGENLTDETDMKGYIYGIRSVDGSGRESDMKTRDSGQ